MSIVGQIYNAVYAGREQTAQSNSTSGTSAATKSIDGRSVSLAALHQGDTFMGQVLDVNNQNVTIQLSGNQQLTARLGEQVSLNIGDTLLFQVKEKNGEQMFIKPMPNQENSQMSAIAERALTANGFSLSAKNGNIAMALMNAGEPLDKANILKLMQQSYKYPDASLDTLVAMNKLELPVTEGNIREFESYMQNTHQMANTLESMSQSAVQAFTQSVDGASLSQMMELHNILVGITGSGESAVNAAGEGTPNVPIAEAGVNTENVSVLTGDALQVADDIASLDGEQSPLLKLDNPKLAIDSGHMTAMVEILADENVSVQDSFSMFQNANSPAELLAALSSKLAAMSEEGAKKLLQSEGYKELTKEALKKIWSLDPNEMTDPKEIDDLFEKMQKDADTLSMAFGKHEAGEEFQNQSNHLKDQMKFMQDLNQNFIYSQIPMKVSDQVTNSELFVYADKKKLAEKKDSVSVLLHLDMEHLGPTDVHVSLTGKNVHAIFYLPEQKSVQIVASNMSELADKLKEKGLTLSNEVVKRPEVKKSPVVEEIIDPDMEKSVKRYNFDVRM